MSSDTHTMGVSQPAAWDPDALHRSAGGDPEFAALLIGSFLEASARNHAAISAASGAGDLAGIREALHALKGICGYIGAAPLIDALTAAGHALARGESATVEVGTVGVELARVEAGLRAYIDGRSGTRPAEQH